MFYIWLEARCGLLSTYLNTWFEGWGHQNLLSAQLWTIMIFKSLSFFLNRLIQSFTSCLDLWTFLNLGHRFEHLAYLLEQADGHERLGVCLDTCHVFAAGYDIRTPEAYAATMEEFDRVVGLEHIKVFHFNDSQGGLSEGKDRHAHIGEGAIGLEGFANFVNDQRWIDHAAHLETPKKETDEEGNEVEMDPINLKALRELRK